MNSDARISHVMKLKFLQCYNHSKWEMWLLLVLDDVFLFEPPPSANKSFLLCLWFRSVNLLLVCSSAKVGYILPSELRPSAKSLWLQRRCWPPFCERRSSRVTKQDSLPSKVSFVSFFSLFFSGYMIQREYGLSLLREDSWTTSLGRTWHICPPLPGAASLIQGWLWGRISEFMSSHFQGCGIIPGFS